MKIGDPVKIVETLYHSPELQVGATGVVTAITEDGSERPNTTTYWVHMDVWPDDEAEGNNWPFYDDEIEVIAQ